ncbi:MAG: RNA polymerase subunit sigma-70 [Crocinitomicaceae bacterium]|nr:RNA polymerase subunit sigma-70 [Crocinitomicaceae bacterium]|tara:strand:- start:21438 stop:21989 length:552 start_codon:yes stop_codon:yes gene_type:complete
MKDNRKAQFALYRSCYSILLSVCLRYEKNKEDAEFLLNKGFMKILTKLHLFKDDRPFEAWIRRIMINAIIDEHRKYSKQKNIIQFSDIQSVGSNDSRWVEYNAADLNFEAEELLGMVQQLPPESRKVFNLYTIEGYAHKEIANMLGISDGTSKWHLSFARKKLREMIALAVDRAGNSYYEQGK